MKKLVVALSVLTACVAFANPYAKCAGCHGAQGEKVALGKSKVIKDMTKADFIAAMKGYKDGTYGGPMKTLMQGQVRALSDADIEKMADQIAKK